MNDNFSKQIVVLGMHRSGTSILSKILIQLGINMGGGDHIGDTSNVEGHNEDVKLLAINDSILASLNSTWDNPPNKEQIKIFEPFIHKKYVSFVNGKNGLWGVKEPRLSLFAAEFNVLLSNPKYIYIVRNEDCVAKSLHVRDGMRLEKAIALKKRYDAGIIDFLSDKNYLKIQYEDLIKDPFEVLNSICNFLELDLKESAISHIKDIKTLKKVKKEKLLQNVKYRTFRTIKNPRKLFSKDAVGFIKLTLRRIKELYF